jgi:hypothetical protein
MSDVATFVRIFEPSPTDDFVTKRIQAAKDIAARYIKKGTPIELIATADNIAAAVDGVSGVDTAFADDISKIISQQSTAFVRDERPQEFQAMLLIGAHQVFAGSRGASTVLLKADVLAAALWSALSYQAPSDKPKFEALRKAVLERARRWALEAAETSRRRSAIPEITLKMPESPDFENVSAAIKTATQNAITPLRDNAALDREEINMLWWVLGDHSTFLEAPFGKPVEHVGAVVAGIELGALLRRPPGDAHRHLVIRHAKTSKRHSLNDILEGLGATREKIAAAYSAKAALEDAPYVFPLITAIVEGESADDEKLTAAEWGARALLEAGLLNTPNMLNG